METFVRLDYEMKIENGRLQTKENLTPAKRYSYLVGENEPCHTAISRFERFIIDSMADPEHPTLDDVENAVSVEKVTDEFFKLYCVKNWKKMKIFVLKQNSTILHLPSSQRN